MATLIGIDYGHKKIGFAIGQTITETSKPLDVIYQNGEMWYKIGQIFKTWRPSAIVIGKPTLADGKEHPLEKSIETFILKLENRYNVVVYRVNEAFTSYEASQHLSCKGKNIELDAYAAAIFLESWMRENSSNL